MIEWLEQKNLQLVNYLLDKPFSPLWSVSETIDRIVDRFGE